MPFNPPIALTLGDINVAAKAALLLLNPLSAQLDGLLSFALGPLMADLAVNYNAALAASATFTLQIGDPLANLKLLLAAVAQLQAALQAALILQLPSVELSAELTASLALVGALSVRLGLLNALIKAAINIKLGALKFAADLDAKLSAGPVVIFDFTNETLSDAGNHIQGLFTGPGIGPVGPSHIAPGDSCLLGIVMVTKDLSAKLALDVIIKSH